MSEATHYIGNELELFGHAHHWKRYYRKHLSPFIQGNVLEVGAGKIPPEEIRTILTAKNRQEAAVSVPAHGLFLWEILY